MNSYFFIKIPGYPHASKVCVGSVAAHFRLKQLGFQCRPHAAALGKFSRRSDTECHGFDWTLSDAQNRLQTATQVAGVRLFVSRNGLEQK